MGLFDKLKSGLSDKVNSILASMGKVDEQLFDEIEEALILSDMGFETADEIIGQLKSRVRAGKMTRPDDIKKALQEIIVSMLDDGGELSLLTKPSVIIVIGVNGTGKTTTIGKLTNMLVKQGRSVLVAAADTFRAAAIEQLEIWTKRAGADIIKHKEGADPSAVVFDAIQAAKARGIDVLICDTAGRLHTKKNLMDELAKISRVIDRELPDSSRETLLVIDATTGQNGITQAKAFNAAAGITGLVLSKLDGTAKGGIVISIKNVLGVPVKLIGTGEKIEDISYFNAKEFASEIF